MQLKQIIKRLPEIHGDSSATVAPTAGIERRIIMLRAESQDKVRFLFDKPQI
jgi:hypothetical protein